MKGDGAVTLAEHLRLAVQRKLRELDTETRLAALVEEIGKEESAAGREHDPAEIKRVLMQAVDPPHTPAAAAQHEAELRAYIAKRFGAGRQ